MTEIDETTPRVWIGSLAAYNAGNLLGDWFDAETCPTTAREWIDELIERGKLRKGKVVLESEREALAQYHEEIWVFDHENFMGALKGECSPWHAYEIATALANVDDDKRKPFAYWLEHEHTGPIETTTFEEFEDEFYGEWDNPETWAEEFLTETGGLANVPDDLRGYIDLKAWARDSGLTFERTPDGTVWVFR